MCDIFLLIVGGGSFLFLLGWATNKSPILGILVFFFGGLVIVIICLAIADAIGIRCSGSSDNCESEYTRFGLETHCTP